ncbi:CoxG family protein [Solibacillus daqui]|uniref:CoxG family protein n=1 Tax=Solibacillus daqui TaxID=2912187 RepID=UPI0023659557|nr:SRPBCC family protein [Solibacillus daqui]
MAQASHSVQIPVAQDKVWAFVSKIEKWATLVPAYKDHKQIDELTSHWTFEGNFKGLSKKIQLEIKIVEMNEPSSIKFEIKGLSDNFSGGGEFKAEPKDGGTYMTGTVEVNAGGLSGAVLTPAIKVVLPKITSRLTEKIARHIQA